MNRTTRRQSRTQFYSIGYLPVEICLTASGLEHLSGYLQTVSEHLFHVRDEFIRSVDAEMASLGLSGKSAQAFLDSREEEHGQKHEFFPSTIRSSVLVMACTQLEAGLVALCQRLQCDARVLVKTRWEGLTDHGIRKAAKFLDANFGVRCSRHQAWQQILHYYTLRNCIVHAAGDIDAMSSKNQQSTRGAIRYLAELGVSEDDTGRLVLPREFVATVICEMRCLWGALAKALEENSIVGPAYWP